MLKKTLCAVLALMTALSLCACASSFEDEYYYTEDYSEDSAGFDLNGTMIRNYASLKGAVTKLVNSYGEHARLIFSNYTGNLSEDLAAVCYEVQSTTPLGAFSVETLRYETSRFVTYYAADIYVTYSRSAQEVSAVRSVTGEDALRHIIEGAILNCNDTMVFKYYSSKADAAYVKAIIDSVFEQSPLLVVSQPRVEVLSYPETGTNRIYEVFFTYDRATSQISAMRTVLRNEAMGIADGFTQEMSWARAVACAEYLSQNCAVDESEIRNTAYDAIVSGSANSEGIAKAYSALCALMDIECIVVRGSLGIGSAIPHFWNLVKIDDEYYHFDVSRTGELGIEQTVLLRDESIWGEYLWDSEQYPTCSGELSYATLYAPADPVETEGDLQE